jgi:hypothetical protein
MRRLVKPHLGEPAVHLDGPFHRNFESVPVIEKNGIHEGVPVVRPAFGFVD